ncbi:pirin family protein [Lysobacter silvisoli]|uniref:Pirin family protein n=1 Tax=Lysobacter silvisoli TaxID=2293254 RepID=A0A371JX08_9GAMM|nr:pirin family protein [Lysobacter silvisoli]RDZ26199.1 pirin family protein [Lysobacter silvisoli]
MIVERPSGARGRVQAGWLDSRHTFSFGSYYDPAWMGFGALRVINEDRVAPGAGFSPHRHANMEILSYVLEGGLAHQDSSGGGGTIRPGALQWMSAGHGVEHSEYNASDAQPVHFLQIWIQPDRLNAQPAYGQREAAAGDYADGWTLLASPDGEHGSLAIRQQAWLHGARPAPGAALERELDPQRLYWLHVARGEVEAGGRRLQAGDALGYREESGPLRIVGAGGAPADLLLFDLPA